MGGDSEFADPGTGEALRRHLETAGNPHSLHLPYPINYYRCRSHRNGNFCCTSSPWIFFSRGSSATNSSVS